MSTLNTRNAYFPSAGSATGPAFDGFWTDTSAAVVLAGVWDTPSESADGQFVLSGSVTYPNTNKVLVAQYVFPAFGATMEFQTPGYGPWLLFGLSCRAMACAVKTSGNAALSVRAQAIAKVFKADGSLRYYMTATPAYNTGALPYTTLTGNAWGTSTNGSVSSPADDDYLVIEVGFAAIGTITGATPHTYAYTVTFQMGDTYSAYQTLGSATMANSGFELSWWGTYIPPAPPYAGFVPSEFLISVTNWTVTGAAAGLKVAGPGSVRI